MSVLELSQAGGRRGGSSPRGSSDVASACKAMETIVLSDSDEDDLPNASTNESCGVLADVASNIPTLLDGETQGSSTIGTPQQSPLRPK